MTTLAEVMARCPSDDRCGSVDDCSTTHSWPGWMPGSAGRSAACRFRYLSYCGSPVMRRLNVRHLVAGSSAMVSAMVNVTLSPASAGSGAQRLVIAILPASRSLFAEQLALAALVERPQAGSQIGAVDKNLFTQ